MKTLLLLRHAKTEPAALKGDKKRGLTKQGRRDAKLIGQQLPAITKRPDKIITSDARRARQTAKIVARTTGYKKRLSKKPKVYAAAPATLLRLIQHLPDTAKCVLLVGHNPGLEALGLQLSGENKQFSHLPTAGLLKLEFEVAQLSFPGRQWLIVTFDTVGEPSRGEGRNLLG